MIGEKASDATVVAALMRARKPTTKYTAILASNCFGDVPPSDPLWVACAEIEPHGAVCITRITAYEQAEQFELSSAEVDALIAMNPRRRALMKRYQAERNVPYRVEDLGELDDIPF